MQPHLHFSLSLTFQHKGHTTKPLDEFYEVQRGILRVEVSIILVRSMQLFILMSLGFFPMYTTVTLFLFSSHVTLSLS